MGRRPSLILVILLVVLGALLILKSCEADTAERERSKAELEAGLAASRILESRFSETGTLKAADVRGRAVANGACTSGYVFDNDQQTIAPFSVNYFVDLSKVDRASLRWNASDRVMFVELPGVTVEQPNIDMSRAQSKQSGTFISRACGQAMQRQVAGRLSAAAEKEANRPDLLERARRSARTRVANLIRVSLAAGQVGDVDVRVRLATDPHPSDDRVWDMSRTIAEVLADPILD